MQRIKVLHILTAVDIGGVEKYVRLLAQHLDPERFEVAIAASPQGKDIRRMMETGIPFYPISHLQKPICPGKDLLAFWEIWRLLKAHRFDIVHTHMFKAGLLGRIAARMQGVPVVLFTAHGFDFNAFFNPFMKRIAYTVEYGLAFFSHMILAVSQADAEAAIHHGIVSRHKIQCVYPGIETNPRVLPGNQVPVRRDSLGIPPRVKIVGMVGRLASPKSPWILVQAAGLLLRQRNDFRILFIGDGPQRPSLEKEIQEQGVADYVNILGYRQDVEALLGLLDIFVLSTLCEGQPISIMEAMLNGVPVITSQVTGLAELVRPQRTGLLVPPADPPALADALARLMENPSLGTRLAQAAREHLRRKYSVQGMVERIQDIYTRLLPAAGDVSVA